MIISSINADIFFISLIIIMNEKTTQEPNKGDGLTLHPCFFNNRLIMLSQVSEISVENTSLNHCKRKVAFRKYDIQEWRHWECFTKGTKWSPLYTFPVAAIPKHLTSHEIINLANRGWTTSKVIKLHSIIIDKQRRDYTCNESNLNFSLSSN